MLFLLLACGVQDFDGDGVPSSRDCDDENASRFPGAPELCDGVDNDCDGQVDLAALDALVLHWDGDSDGLGDPEQQLESCEWVEGWVDNADDCDDGDFLVGGGDEWFYDREGIGCGDPDMSVVACEPPPHYVDRACEVEPPEPEACTPPSLALIEELDPAGGADVAFDPWCRALVSGVSSDLDAVVVLDAEGLVERLPARTAHGIAAITVDDEGRVLATLTGLGLARMESDGPVLLAGFDTPRGENWNNNHQNRFASSIAFDPSRGCTWVPNVGEAGRLACLDATGEVELWELPAYVEAVALDEDGVLWASVGTEVLSEGGEVLDLRSPVLDLAFHDGRMAVETVDALLDCEERVCQDFGAQPGQAKLAPWPAGGVLRMQTNPSQDARYALY